MKVAVSIPDPVFNAADRLAHERNLPRSQLITEALREYLDRHGAAAITAKLNLVYSAEESSVEPGLNQAQLALVEDEAW